jgi:hypothetical protein
MNSLSITFCLYYTDESVALIRFGIRSPALTIYLRA